MKGILICMFGSLLSDLPTSPLNLYAALFFRVDARRKREKKWMIRRRGSSGANWTLFFFLYFFPSLHSFLALMLAMPILLLVFRSPPCALSNLCSGYFRSVLSTTMHSMLEHAKPPDSVSLRLGARELWYREHALQNWWSQWSPPV